jgi:hypothetical protein
MLRWWIAIVLSSTVSLSSAATPVADLRAEVEKLRKELSAREEAAKVSPVGKADEAVSSRYGPNAPVTVNLSQDSRLEIQGLAQIWYQSVQNDNRGITVSPFFFSGANPRIQAESNEGNDNDTFRIRRFELRFSLDLTKNVSLFVMLDPARQHNPIYYPLPTLPRHNVPSGSESFEPLRTGAIPDRAIKPQLLQDAYVSFYEVVPHHSFAVGQFKPPSGEEAWRNSAQLDFVERSMVAGINNVRDIGAMVSGTWVNDRVRYAFGVFNGPAGTVLSDPEVTEAGNRSDENDEKDIAWRVAVRPVWDMKKWYGRLELGAHRTDGVHGEAGSEFDPDFGILNGVNIKRTDIVRMGAWGWYRPAGPVRGWWFRGEWGSGHDRYGAGAFTGLFGAGSVDLGGGGPRGGNAFTQANPAPVNVSGWYFATGYKLSESRFAEGLKKGGALSRALHDMEFAFRYETYENVEAEDLVQSDRHTDQFKTQVYTAGVNYNLKKYDARIQANYLFVDDPSSGNPIRGFREVRNDVFVVNFQVGF